jgi:hypothetical protein
MISRSIKARHVLFPARIGAAGPSRNHRRIPRAATPEEIPIVAPAGSVLVFDSHLWRRGAEHESERSRRALQSVFHTREATLPLGAPLHDRPETPPAVTAFILSPVHQDPS